MRLGSFDGQEELGWNDLELGSILPEKALVVRTRRLRCFNYIKQDDASKFDVTRFFRHISNSSYRTFVTVRSWPDSRCRDTGAVHALINP